MGKIRAVEVLHQPETEHPRGADRDVRIAGKIAINLKRKENRRQNQREPLLVGQVVIDKIDILGQHIGNDELLEETDRHHTNAVRGVLFVEEVILKELWHEVFAALNRARDELRKKRDEQRVDTKVLLRFDVPAIDVDDIGEALERVERNADGQNDVQRGGVDGDGDQRERLFDRGGEEVEILKKEQHEQRNRNADGKNRFPRALGAPGRGQEPRGEVGIQRDAGDEHHELRIPAHVEIVAGKQQKNPAEPMRQREVCKKDDDEENGELPGVEQHSVSFPVVESSVLYHCGTRIKSLKQ